MKEVKKQKFRIELDPNDASTWNSMGVAYSNKSDYDNAIKCYKKAIELDPNKALPWYNMGNAYSNKYDYDKAVECYKKAIELDPNDASTWNNMGIAYSDKNDYDIAIKCYKKAIELNPNKDLPWYNMGNAYSNKYDYDKAVECYKKAIELDPYFLEAYRNLIVAYIDLKDFERAFYYNRKAIDFNPTFPRIKSFEIGDFLMLRLIGDTSYIYVNNERFVYFCQKLILNIDYNDIEKYDSINSIDEASELNKGEKHNPKIISISPEEEFWGHCSNLQAWVENDYDTRILHTNLAFPLLKKLNKVGDPLAKRVFKEEIAKKFTSNYRQAQEFLVEEGYLNFLSTEEINILLENSIVDNDLREIIIQDFILLTTE